MNCAVRVIKGLQGGLKVSVDQRSEELKGQRSLTFFPHVFNIACVKLLDQSCVFTDLCFVVGHLLFKHAGMRKACVQT